MSISILIKEQLLINTDIIKGSLFIKLLNSF